MKKIFSFRIYILIVLTLICFVFISTNEAHAAIKTQKITVKKLSSIKTSSYTKKVIVAIKRNNYSILTKGGMIYNVKFPSKKSCNQTIKELQKKYTSYFYHNIECIKINGYYYCYIPRESYTKNYPSVFYNCIKHYDDYSKKIYSIAKNLNFKRTDSDEYKANKIAQYMASHVSYDNKCNIDKKASNSMMPYYAALYGKTICGGFSDMYSDLCYSCGLHTQTYFSFLLKYHKFSHIGHSFNRIKINNKWYYYDMTGYSESKSSKYLKKAKIEDMYNIDLHFTNLINSK